MSLGFNAKLTIVWKLILQQGFIIKLKQLECHSFLSPDIQKVSQNCKVLNLLSGYPTTSGVEKYSVFLSLGKEGAYFVEKKENNWYILKAALQTVSKFFFYW